MAKGRKLTTSRSDIFLGNIGYNQSQAMETGDPELGEHEVWSMLDGMVSGYDQSSNGEWTSRASVDTYGSYGSYRSRRPPPQADQHQQKVGGLSLAFHDSSNGTQSSRIVHQSRAGDRAAESPRGRHVATSAPVNVPDWSKIYRMDSVESLHDSDDGLYDCDSELVPPHEYLARSRRMAADSVFEGVGRTLKGRDMSRVRDAVWSRTGFDG